mgnify:CR=1 FL=1
MTNVQVEDLLVVRQISALDGGRLLGDVVVLELIVERQVGQMGLETPVGAGVEAGGGERTFHAHLNLMCLYFIGNCLQCLEIVDAVNRLNACPGRIEVLLQQLLIVDAISL